MYAYSIILLLATLLNFTHSYIIQEMFDGTWYHFIHKAQLVIILIASFKYQHSAVNFLAGVGYIGIVLLNWIFYFWDWFGYAGSISAATSILYALALILILFIEWHRK